MVCFGLQFFSFIMPCFSSYKCEKKINSKEANGMLLDPTYVYLVEVNFQPTVHIGI